MLPNQKLFTDDTSKSADAFCIDQNCFGIADGGSE